MATKKSFSILVVDDEPVNFDVIEALLSSNKISPENKPNCQLHYVANGEAAISSLDVLNPDLILLDVLMPGLDGVEVCRQIKAIPKWQVVPIIIVTVLTARAEISRCIKAGANDFINKPISPVDLNARVRSMLIIKQQHDQIQKLKEIQQNTINVLENVLTELQGNLSSQSVISNNPWNGVLARIRWLETNLENMDVEAIYEGLNLANNSLQYLQCLTDKFRVYLELELLCNLQQDTEEVQSQCSILAIREELKAYAESLNRGNDLILAIAPAQVQISKKYLNIILHELLDNALNFSQTGQAVTIRSQVEGNILNLYVEDNGKGMSLEQIEQIAPFTQFESKPDQRKGLGIGLEIVRRIVELAEGAIAITSNYSQGTTVHLTLPLVEN